MRDKFAVTHNSHSKQLCYLDYTKGVSWESEAVVACQKIIDELNLRVELIDMQKQFNPNKMLIDNTIEELSKAGHVIIDISYNKIGKDSWAMPRDVFIRLGMAIALNCKILLLRHTSNNALVLPEIFAGLKHQIINFGGWKTLYERLIPVLSSWLQEETVNHSWSLACSFGTRICQYREVHPRLKNWDLGSVDCFITDGEDIDQEEFRAETEEVLDRFGDISYTFLDKLPLNPEYDFHICTYCQSSRKSAFAIYRLTENTTPAAYISIGMQLALEHAYQYKIPKLIITENSNELPILLQGLSVIQARTATERRQYIKEFMPSVLDRAREKTWLPRQLPYLHLQKEDETMKVNRGGEEVRELTETKTEKQDTPLSVLLFADAMKRQKSVSDYAEVLDIGAISLRQFIEGNTQRPRTKSLELIGSALNMSVEEVRTSMSIRPKPEIDFGEWLDKRMKASGFSRARLVRDTEISDGALRNYLSNKTLPDADQAARLAEALGADNLEVASIIVSNTVAIRGSLLENS